MSDYDAVVTKPAGDNDAEAYSRSWWIAKIEAEKKAHKKFREEAKKAQEAYFPPEENKQAQYPIFWSNTKITHGALYARTPKPDVRKRYKDVNEQLAPRKVALAIERALEFTLDQEDIDDHAHRCVDDFLVAGLGVAKVEYEATTAEQPAMNPMTQQPVFDDEGQPVMTKVITSQRCELEYIPWDRYLWEPCKSDDECNWKAIKHYMSKDAAEKKFGVEIRDVDSSGSTSLSVSPQQPNEAKYTGQVVVYEIWCRTTRKLHWIGETVWQIDVTEDDPLNLQGFYPITRPMMLNVKFGSLIPKTDYSYIERQCMYVDTLSSRIMMLTKQIKDVGAYDSSFPELAEIASPDVADGTYKPVNQLAMRLASTDGRANFDSILAVRDNTNKVAVVQTLMQMREQAIQAIYQITGISDIVRGATQASETAEAQRLKGQWANVRLVEKQAQVNGFFREIFRIMAEVIGEHFQPEQIRLMTGVELSAEELAILKQDASRNFVIDVETDSTIAIDQQADNAQRMEMVNTFMQFFQITQPLVAQNMMPATLAKEVIATAVGGMKYAGSLTDAIDELPDNAAQLKQMQEQIMQGQQQMQQMQTQIEQMTKQLQQADMGKQQLEAQRIQLEGEKVRQAGAKTASEIEGNQFDADKTFAETQEILTRIGKIEADIQATKVGTAKDINTPIKDPNAMPPMRPRAQ